MMDKRRINPGKKGYERSKKQEEMGCRRRGIMDELSKTYTRLAAISTLQGFRTFEAFPWKVCHL